MSSCLKRPPGIVFLDVTPRKRLGHFRLSVVLVQPLLECPLQQELSVGLCVATGRQSIWKPASLGQRCTVSPPSLIGLVANRGQQWCEWRFRDSWFAYILGLKGPFQTSSSRSKYCFPSILGYLLCSQFCVQKCNESSPAGALLFFNTLVPLNWDSWCLWHYNT